MPVVAGLDPAHETRRLGPIIVDGAPGIAEIAPEIGAGPAIAIELLRDGVGSIGRRARPVIRNVGRLRRDCKARARQCDRGKNQPAHATLPRNCRYRSAGLRADDLRKANLHGYGTPLFSDKVYRES